MLKINLHLIRCILYGVCVYNFAENYCLVYSLKYLRHWLKPSVIVLAIDEIYSHLK